MRPFALADAADRDLPDDLPLSDLASLSRRRVRRDLALRAWIAAGTSPMINIYGPTETTISHLR